jgi:hypothetical protein
MPTLFLLSLACDSPCADGYGLSGDGVCVALAGTGDADTDTDSDSDTDSDTDSDADTDLAPVDALILAECSPCHTDGGRAGDLGYTGLDSLIDVPSGQSNLDYIEPGSRDDSYVWHKVSGTHRDVGGTGLQMPDPNHPLSSDDMNTLGAWIDAGAPN